MSGFVARTGRLQQRYEGGFRLIAGYVFHPFSLDIHAECIYSCVQIYPFHNVRKLDSVLQGFLFVMIRLVLQVVAIEFCQTMKSCELGMKFLIVFCLIPGRMSKNMSLVRNLSYWSFFNWSYVELGIIDSKMVQNQNLGCFFYILFGSGFSFSF